MRPNAQATRTELMTLAKEGPTEKQGGSATVRGEGVSTCDVVRRRPVIRWLPTVNSVKHFVLPGDLADTGLSLPREMPATSTSGSRWGAGHFGLAGEVPVTSETRLGRWNIWSVFGRITLPYKGSQSPLDLLDKL